MPKRKSKTAVQAQADRQTLSDKVDKLTVFMENLMENVLPKIMSRPGRAVAEDDNSSHAQHDGDERGSQATDTEQPQEVAGPESADSSAADRAERGSEASSVHSDITNEELPPTDIFLSPKQKKIIQQLVDSG